MTHYAPRITSPARAARPRTRRIHPLAATLVLATAALLATPDTAQAQACPGLTGRQQIWTGTVTVVVNEGLAKRPCSRQGCIA
jgi:hypothetical protein